MLDSTCRVCGRRAPRRHRCSARLGLTVGRRRRPSPTRRKAQDAPTVRKLIKEGADVNAAQGDGMTALHWAALNGDAELASMLLYAGANVGAKTRLGGYTPLHLAAQVGHAGVIAPLVAARRGGRRRHRDRRHAR